MPVVELGEICEFLDHRRRPVSEEFRQSGPYPYYGANGQQGWIDSYIFDEPLVLLAEDGGHFGSTTKPIAYRIAGKTWVNNHAHVLRPGATCDIDYLTHALSFYDVSKLIGGTTRPKLTKGNAELIKLPLPGLSEQKRIAGQLEQADWLRNTRRYALELSDTLHKPRKAPTKKDLELQDRLRGERAAGWFGDCSLDIADLQDIGVLDRRMRLGKGELASIAFAKKAGLAFLTDDQKARILGRSVIARDRIQTTPHLFGWLVFSGELTDSDKDPVIAEHEEYGGQLRPYFEATYREALRCRLMART